MSRLESIFTQMQNPQTKAVYLQSTSGKDFEDRFKKALDDAGYNRIISEDVRAEKWFGHLKAVILDIQTARHPDNPSEYSQHYIQSPYGSQQYPDFLILDEERVEAVEIKLSKQSKPMWNSGLPRQSGIYIFGSPKKKDMTFFKGSSVITSGEAKTLHNFFEKLNHSEQSFNDNNMRNQAYGFSAYIRKAFDQKKSHNSQGIIDFFGNPNRQNLETAVIKYLKSASP